MSAESQMVELSKNLAIELIPIALAGSGIPAPITRIVLESLFGVLQEQQNSLETQIGALQEQQNKSDEKLRRLVGSYYLSGKDYLNDARSLQGERRKESIKSALGQFIAASHVEDTLLAANSQFFVGVCHDLLNESPEAKRWYEQAYTAAYQLIAHAQPRSQEFKQLQQFMNSLSQVLVAHGSTLSIAQLIPALGFSFYNNQGNAFYQLQRYQAALTAYEQALRLNPNSATIYSNKGHALQLLGQQELGFLQRLRRLEEALAAYEQAILLDPNNATYYYNKANLLELLGRKKKAQKFYGKARQLEFLKSLSENLSSHGKRGNQ